MRYYWIKLTDGSGNPLTPPSLQNAAAASGSGIEPGVITSHVPNGTMNPGALNIELDVVAVPEHIGDTTSYVRIYGLGLKDIARGFDLNNKFIEVKVGMAPGYPLNARAKQQQGTILKCGIWQCFGNWMGTDMTLDIMMSPSKGGDGGVGFTDGPVNFDFEWKVGETLSSAIGRAYMTGLGTQVKINISVDDNNRVAKEVLKGHYPDLPALARAIQDHTRHQKGRDDDGVILSFDGLTAKAAEADGSANTDKPTTQLDFNDLLGQVTYYDYQQVTAKLVMRGDLQLFQNVVFPRGLVTTVTANSVSNLGGARDDNSLGAAGTWMIQKMQYWGNFRQPDATAWNTTIWCVQKNTGGNGGGGNGSSTPASSTPSGGNGGGNGVVETMLGGLPVRYRRR